MPANKTTKPKGKTSKRHCVSCGNKVIANWLGRKKRYTAEQMCNILDVVYFLKGALKATSS